MPIQPIDDFPLSLLLTSALGGAVLVQMALAPYLNLPQEIESLRMVIDMRTEEIQKLRKQNMDLEKQVILLVDKCHCQS